MIVAAITPTAAPGDPSPDEPHDDDGRDAEQTRHDAVRGDAVDPERRPEREVDGVQRWVTGARHLDAVEHVADRVEEELSVGERVGLVVVVERVAPEAVPEVSRPVGGGPPPEDVHQADQQAEPRGTTEPERERPVP